MPASKVADFSSGIEVYGCPVVPSVGGRMCMGDLYYVDSGNTTNGADDTAHGTTKDEPFLTLDYALSQCTANNGDFIILLPGHSETLSAVQTIDKAGVTVLGIGNGSLRPTFTQTAAADGLDITADDVMLHNVMLKQTTANSTGLVNIQASNAVVEGCYFSMGAKALKGITVASGDDVKIINNEFVITADGPDVGIGIEGCTRLLVQFNIFDGTGLTTMTANAFDEAAIQSSLSGAGSGTFAHNIFKQGTVGTEDIISCASWTNQWIFAYNTIWGADAKSHCFDAVGAAVCIENYAGWSGGKYGLIVPPAAETT